MLHRVISEGMTSGSGDVDFAILKSVNSLSSTHTNNDTLTSIIFTSDLYNINNNNSEKENENDSDKSIELLYNNKEITPGNG